MKCEDATCIYLAQADSKFCPRHSFLHNLNAKAAEDKEQARALAKRAKHDTAFPKTAGEMIARGYRRNGTKRCQGCGKHIEWWLTPANRPIPMDPAPYEASPAVSHFATCTNAARFRKVS